MSEHPSAPITFHSLLWALLRFCGAQWRAIVIGFLLFGTLLAGVDVVQHAAMEALRGRFQAETLQAGEMPAGVAFLSEFLHGDGSDFRRALSLRYALFAGPLSLAHLGIDLTLCVIAAAYILGNY